jgi:hypothetical protein
MLEQLHLNTLPSKNVVSLCKFWSDVFCVFKVIIGIALCCKAKWRELGDKHIHSLPTRESHPAFSPSRTLSEN